VIVTLHLVALALYGLATALTLAPFMGFRPAPRALTIALPSAGAAIHVVGISQLTLVASDRPCRCWRSSVLLQLASEKLLRGSASRSSRGRSPRTRRTRDPERARARCRNRRAATSGSCCTVALSALGVALMALAFIAAALYLLQFRELKARALARSSSCFRRSSCSISSIALPSSQGFPP